MKNLVVLIASFCFFNFSCEKDATNSLEKQNIGIPLIVSEMYDEDLGWRYTYNEWNLPEEVRTKWSYQKFYYDNSNRIVRYDMYEDQGIYSSNWETADAAMHRTTWVDPGNTDKTGYATYTYDNGKVKSISFFRTMGFTENTSEYYFDDHGRISSTVTDDTRVEYRYDSHGNILKTKQYFNGKLWAMKEYEYDSHPNPFIVFKITALPGRYTNTNNIISERQVVYDNSGYIENEWTETSSYKYNILGYPVKANDMVTYEYR